MKIIKTILKIILAILIVPQIVLFGYVAYSGKWFIYKAIRYNFVNIDDYKIFENRDIPASENPKHWSISKNYNNIPLSDTLTKTLEKHQSVAFLVIKNDSIMVEKYWDSYADTSISNGFSMAKSVISLLVGCAIQDGKIKSVEQPVADFIPEFKNGEKSKITIKHLLQMSSGLDFDESKSYRNPVSVFFSDIMEAYYGTDLYTLVTNTEASEKPGVYFDYKGGDTQLLAFIVMKATGKNISTYFYEKIYNNIGAESEAKWCIDKKDGNEKAFCCLNTTARDFAKIGKLVLNKGKIEGKQIVDSSFLVQAILPSKLKDKSDTTKIVDFYGYQFWMMSDIDKNIVYLRGTLGQFVIIIPDKNIIIVRLGKSQGEKQGFHYGQTYVYVNEILKTF